MTEMFIALKHIKERKKQSIIAVLGIAIGVLVLTVSLGIANGLDKNMVNSILSLNAHVNVSNSEVKILNYLEVKNKIENIKGVKGVLPKYSTQGIIKYEGIYGTFVSGVMINGVRNEELKPVLKMDEKVKNGKAEFKNKNDILIGQELAKQIGADTGDRIKLISPESKELYFNIAGIFHSGYYDFDTSLVIVPLAAVQYISEADDIVTEIDVMINDVYAADKIALEIRKLTGLNTRTWGEMNRNLLYALALEKTVMIILLSLIIIISGFVVGVILNTLVREKTKDIGILRSFGFSSNNIMKIFLLEGIILGGSGIIFGMLFSAAIIYYLKTYSFKLPLDIYYIDKVPMEISFNEIGIIILGTWGIILLSSILPAYKASKLKPVEALRYE